MSHLTETYFRHWHVLKLRIIEVRRLCFSGSSFFEFENASAHHRKCLERISQSWVLIGLLAGKNYSLGLSKSHNPRAIYNQLNKDEAFSFPSPARLTQIGDREPSSGKATFKLDTGNGEKKIALQIVKKYEDLHRFQHSMSPLDCLPIPSEIELILNKNFKALAHENQILWNGYCQHVVKIDESWFFINLGMDDLNSPTIIQMEDNRQLERDVDLTFPTKLISGWSEMPEWSDMKQALS